MVHKRPVLPSTAVWSADPGAAEVRELLASSAAASAAAAASTAATAAAMLPEVSSSDCPHCLSVSKMVRCSQQHLLVASQALMGSLFPAEDNHFLSLDELRGPEIRFFTAELEDVRAISFSFFSFFFSFRCCFISTAASPPPPAPASSPPPPPPVTGPPHGNRTRRLRTSKLWSAVGRWRCTVGAASSKPMNSPDVPDRGPPTPRVSSSA